MKHIGIVFNSTYTLQAWAELFRLLAGRFPQATLTLVNKYAAHLTLPVDGDDQDADFLISLVDERGLLASWHRW